MGERFTDWYAEKWCASHFGSVWLCQAWINIESRLEMALKCHVDGVCWKTLERSSGKWGKRSRKNSAEATVVVGLEFYALLCCSHESECFNVPCFLRRHALRSFARPLLACQLSLSYLICIFALTRTFQMISCQKSLTRQTRPRTAPKKHFVLTHFKAVQ